MDVTKFEELQLDDRIIRAITEMGFEEASPIQAQAIPVVLEGRDMIGQAQTGTGKTAAFGLPLLQKVDPKVKKLQAIVLLPTRELAIQVAEELRRFAKFMHGIKVLPVYGGQDIVRQIRALKDGTQIVVGTPGRVMDHMRRKTVKMDHVHTVVLDEADEMLNMGFLEDMETILSQLPEERQTLMFSATMPQAIADIAKKFQKDPVTVRVIKKELTVPKVTQYYYEVKPKNKVEVMCRLLDMYAPKLSVAFCNTKKQVDELVQALQGRGYFAEGLHGDLKQEQRDRVMGSFRNGATEILVATDVAARGIDVDDVEAVFNYDIPQDDEYYVHRIGRTGRAGVPGHAVSLVSDDEKDLLSAIEKLLKKRIDLKKAEGYEGEPPADIVADEKERDAARKRELEKLRESRRKQRKEKPAKTEVAKEVHEAVKLEALSVGISDNPDERFEKKIRRKAQQKTIEAQQPQVTKNRRTRREPNSIPRGNNGQVAQDTRRSNERNGAGKTRPARRGTPGTDRRSLRASWEPTDPFAPENQAIFLPQTMPGNFRSHQRNKTRPDNRRDPEGNRFGQERRRSNASNIKSTVQRAPKTAYSDSRFESVSSNLPPGMILRMRRR